jgi:hypothetical protein
VKANHWTIRPSIAIRIIWFVIAELLGLPTSLVMMGKKTLRQEPF